MKLILLSNGCAIWAEREPTLSTAKTHIDVLNMPPGLQIYCNGEKQGAEVTLRAGINNVTVHSKTKTWRAEPLVFSEGWISVKSMLATEESIVKILTAIEKLKTKISTLEKVAEEHKKAIFGNQLF